MLLFAVSGLVSATFAVQNSRRFPLYLLYFFHLNFPRCLLIHALIQFQGRFSVSLSYLARA
jgi:hypothetical protein